MSVKVLEIVSSGIYGSFEYGYTKFDDEQVIPWMIPQELPSDARYQGYFNYETNKWVLHEKDDKKNIG